MALQIDSLLNNRYRIKAILGQGGMGAVYQGVDETLGISIAVKENLFLSEEYAKQFQKEAKILANLRHPNLPRVGDYFYVENQGQYLIMDYIEGEDLRERIERLGLIPQSEAIVIGAVICDALSYLSCRDNPIIHRDIKPGNIKITYTGEISLVDFGLAKIMDGGQITSTGARAMTPGYSPPEQYGTGRTDVRSDIYSLGATIYAAVTGSIPEDALSRVTGKVQLTPIHEIIPEINKKFEKAIHKAMEVEAENRFQNPDDFKISLLDAGKLPNVLPLNLLVPPPPAEGDTITKPERRSPIEYATSPYFLEPLKEFTESQLSSQKGKNPRRNLALFSIITAFMLVLIAGAIFSYQQRAFSNMLSNIVNNLPEPINSSGLINSEFQNTPSQVIQPTNSLSVAELENTETTFIESRENYPIVGGGAEQILFASNRTNVFQLWIMNSNGTEQRQLTSVIGGACQPNWSPDGRKIAFISPCREKLQQYKDAKIFIYNMENGEIEAMPQTVFGDYNPAWAPDGNRIAFSSYRNGVSHIYLYSYITGTLEELSDSRYADMQPVWHPDGKQIAITRKIYFPHVWIISDTGVTQYQFSVTGNLLDIWPSWSPDGDTILYTRSEESPDVPWLVSQEYEDRGRSVETEIPVKHDYIRRPIIEGRYSPDGHWIVFESWPDGTNHDVYVMDINGENIMRLTTDPGIDGNAVWRPTIQ
ncbi:MAG: serine/threonine-protein kinase [Anaerolineaceae bacterium]|nr:serine/threonine-protein kinase [Anaerolineaceae bacterium]